LTIARERSLIEPAPKVTSLRSFGGRTVLALFLALALAGLDVALGSSVVVVSLLAFPPLLAATRGSVAEAAVVGVVCVLLAVLSGVWNDNLGVNDYPVRIIVVAMGAGAAVWVASLRDSLRREHDAAELLAETGLLLQESLDTHDRAEEIARMAVPQLADAATVDIRGPNGAILRAATASIDPQVKEDFIALRRRVPVEPDGGHPVAVAMRTGELQHVPEISDAQLQAFAAEPEELELIRRTRPYSVLVVPLKARDAILGAISLWVLDPGRRHDQRSRNVALRLAHRVGLAMDNARLHEQQAHIATVLQSSLRPRSLPEIAGFEAAARFAAAGEAHVVGGDFYDAFRSGSGNWSLVIGDVCGKGPEAAAVTALARYTVRTASSPESPPSEVLLTLHDSILGDRDDLRFCTAALARVSSPGNGADPARITLALGGHPRPLVLRRDGSVESVGRPGTLLGALPDPTVHDTEASLAPGESLVLYTDGMLEASDRSRAEDPGWLAAQLAAANGAGADEIAEQLADAAIERQGGAPRDDIAVVVLRRSGA
jgi:serine phosphatase RsbU (regulator of sigma subunit)